MRLDSIRMRMVISYVLLAVLTVVLVGVLTLTLMSKFIRAQTESQLRENAEAIARQAEALMQPYPQIDALSELARTLAFLSSAHIRILDSRGAVLVDSGAADQNASAVWVPRDAGPQRELPFLVPLSAWSMRGDMEERRIREIIGKHSSLVIRVNEGPWGRNVFLEEIQAGEWLAQLPRDEHKPFVSPTATAGEARYASTVRAPIGTRALLGYVQVENLGAPGREALDAMRQALLLAGLGAAAVAAVAGLLVSRGLTAPLQTLAVSTTQMSGGDLSARAPLRGASEIKQLAEQFNRMAERLQVSFAALSAERDALRRFIADASHELRTPITALSGFIELLQGQAAADPAAREEFLAESQAQVRRMEWITTNLLDLSRLDAGLVQLDSKEHAVNELLQASVAPFRARAEEQGVLLDVQTAPASLTVRADRARLELALGNLLDNAVKFTPPGGRVVLRVERVETIHQNPADPRGEPAALHPPFRIRIVVEDNGQGIDPADLPHIFDRFYRGRASQNGSGLGLAIVQSLVHAHGGCVEVVSAPGEGSRFEILLP